MDLRAFPDIFFYEKEERRSSTVRQLHQIAKEF